MLVRSPASAAGRPAGSRGRIFREDPPAPLCPRAERLLVRLSVYREPVDRNALLFQIGQHEWPQAPARGGPGPAPPYQEPADLNELLAACAAAGLITVTGTSAGPVTASDSAQFFVDRRAAA